MTPSSIINEQIVAQKGKSALERSIFFMCIHTSTVASNVELLIAVFSGFTVLLVIITFIHNQRKDATTLEQQLRGRIQQRQLSYDDEIQIRFKSVRAKADKSLRGRVEKYILFKNPGRVIIEFVITGPLAFDEPWPPTQFINYVDDYDFKATYFVTDPKNGQDGKYVSVTIHSLEIDSIFPFIRELGDIVITEDSESGPE